MLDRSSKLDDSLMDAYRSIHEIHKGHAAGDSDIEKQASQLASDIRYKAKGRIRDGMNVEDKKRIYLKLLASSPAPGIVKSKAKRKLLGESVLINEIMPAGDTAAERTKNVKRVVRGVGRVAKGVVGIAKREGTLSQKITGAAIDAAKPVVNKVSNWSKSPTASKSETASSYKTRSAKKNVSKPGDKPGPTIDLKRKKGTTNTYEGLSNWRKDLLGEEGYDHWRDKHLERGGIGAVASKSPSRPYKRSEKQPKGDTAYQKEMKAKHGGKLPSALDVVKSKIEKEHGKGAIMKTEETSAADKIINNIRSKRVDEGKLVHGPFGPYITGQKMPKEHREVPLRKVPYEDINSAKKVVGEDAKMGRQSDEKLASLQKQFSGMDQSTPSNQHMLKRVNREINRRKKQKPVGEEVTNEAKVDQKLPEYKRATARDKRYGNPYGSHELGGGIRKDRRSDHEKRRGVKEEVANEAKVDKVKHGDHNLYDNPGKEKDRNERKFGKQSFNQKGQTQLRRGLHWSKRGEKKVKGAKVEEEVGVSSSAAMAKARKEAELKAKEEAAVKKAKKVKNEEVSPAVEKVIESIKINKASPKSPNCIIMPKKDDIADKAGGNGKKSTKNVVSKKQKQFFNQEGKTYKDFLKEYAISTLTKAAAGQAAKGAITTTAKTVGKEGIKQGVKQGATQTAANAITKTGKSLGAGKLAKTTSSAITQVSPKAIEKVKPKTSTLAKSGVKQTAIQTATQTAVDKIGNKKPPTTAEKEPQKQGNQSKGFNLPSLGSRTAKLKTGTIHNKE